MHILFYTRFFWPHFGGVERHVEELSFELMKRGHQITVVTEQYSNDLEIEEIYKGIKIIRIPYFAIGSKRLVWTWMDKHDYLVHQADVVHVHDVFWWYWPTRLLQLIKPVYITFHGYEGSGLPRWQAVLHRKMAEMVSSGSICVGSYIKKWYRSSTNIITYGATNIHNIDLVKSDSEAVFWGRFDNDTGVKIYLDSLFMINGINTLHLYGDGSLTEWIIEFASRRDDIRVHKWENQLRKIVTGRQYAFVSQYLSILEAMRAKMVVAAVYNNAIKRDYLECHPMHDNMIIAGSAKELASKINAIRNNPKKRDRMIERAYAWSKEQTWSKMADMYERLWQT